MPTPSPVQPPSNQDLFAVLLAWVQLNYPGEVPEEVRLQLLSGRKIVLPIPYAPLGNRGAP